MSRQSIRFVVLAATVHAGAAAAPAILRGQGGTPVIPVVTLAEARSRAAAVAPATVAARGQVTAAAWDRRSEVLKLFTPTVTAGAGYIHFSEPFFNFGTGSISPNATSATLQASYLLLGPGKFFGIKRSGGALASAEAGETAARFRTALETDAAYFGVLASRELSAVSAERLRRAQEQFGVARVRVVAGDAIATDSLQLLLEVNRARLDVLRRDSALAVSRLRLGRLIGLPGPADAAPSDTGSAAMPITLDAAVAEVLAQGPELVAARAVERQTAAVLGSQREAYLPDVTLGATTGAYDSQFFPSALKRTQLSVTLTFPVWNGGAREVAVARAHAEAEAARAQREDSERGAAESMAAAYHGYETARAAIELARVGIAVSSETFRVQSARYREGATTILDLLEAQVGLTEAQATLVQSRYAARLAVAQIEALLGRRVNQQ